MEVQEVYDILTERHNKHEEKCDKRQERMYDKLDHLTKLIYIGIGGVLVLELVILTWGS